MSGWIMDEVYLYKTREREDDRREFRFRFSPVGPQIGFRHTRSVSQQPLQWSDVDWKRLHKGVEKGVWELIFFNNTCVAGDFY